MKKLPTAKKTKKKFYNKYIYKVSLNIPGISGLRYYELPKFLEICQTQKILSSPDLTWRDRIMNEMIKNKNVWAKLIPYLNTVEKETYSKRLEGDFIDLYTNDKAFYEGLCNNFSEYVRLRFQPPKGMETEMLEEEKKIFVKKLPYDVYGYRAYLHPHKIAREDKKQLVNWMANQKPKITFTNAIQTWLLNTDQNWDRRYIYIDNEQTLLMIKLRSPNLLGQVFKYELIR